MANEENNRPANPTYVVIGTSAGGGAALSYIFKDLPSDFPAAILIVYHVREPREMTWLAKLLESLGRIPVKVATDGEVIRQGTAYIAPAGTHLLTKGPDRIELGTGPLEQHVRPAVDVLFRSAAEAFGRRVIGVILTGLLQDGALGLRAVGDAGGITIVQDPEGAESPGMPRAAMQELAVDYCVELPDIAPLLDLLVRHTGQTQGGVLETGLASSVRLMKERLRLLSKLHEQSRRNPKTADFIAGEIAALRLEIADLQRQIPASD